MRTITQEQFNNVKKLLELMQSLPQSRVDLSTYGTDDDCGTFACSLGHAAASGIFKHLGLRVEKQMLFGEVRSLPVQGSRGPKEAAKELFGQDSWAYLLSQRNNSPYDRDFAILKSSDALEISDKTLAIHRLQTWLQSNLIGEQPHGQANTAAI